MVYGPGNFSVDAELVRARSLVAGFLSLLKKGSAGKYMNKVLIDLWSARRLDSWLKVTC